MLVILEKLVPLHINMHKTFSHNLPGVGQINSGKNNHSADNLHQSKALVQNQHTCNYRNYSGDSNKSIGPAGPYAPYGSIVQYKAQHRAARSQEKDCSDKAWLRERQQEKP